MATTAKTILIADDTAFVRDRFTAAIDNAGHRAIPVRTAAELLGTVRDEATTLDLVIIDLHLPEANGVETIRAVRQLDNGRIPLLVFSGTVHSVDEVLELGALGVAGYVNEYSAVQHILPAIAPHLFPEELNRRGAPRVVLGIPIAYRVGNTIAAALTLNLSRNGMAIRTSSPLDQAAEARLRFRLPGSKKDIDADARVCWSNASFGMGLQFARVDGEDQSAIDGFVNAHFFQPRKA